MLKRRQLVRYFLVFSICFIFQHIGKGQVVTPSKNNGSYDSFLNSLSFKPEFKVSSKKQFEMKSFDATTLPVFCKIEHKIASASKVAFRFRLGELNYVNMLENKQ